MDTQFQQTPSFSRKPENKFKAWARRNKKLLIFGTPVLALLILSGVIWFVGSNNNPTTEQARNEEPKKEEIPQELPHLLNGVVVSRDLYNRHPVAVMIENSQAARPHVGLTKADVVYEIVTEGGITRFMALYSQDYPEKAGPVRSARGYFVEYLSEYDAFYAHAGGSPTALDRIKKYGIKDYPHSSDSYYREPRAGVASEHTLFVDVSKIFKFGIEKKGWPSTADFKPWTFKDPNTSPGPAVAVKINFSSSLFNVVWNFDPATNTYNRIMAGTAHKDRISGEQIAARTIVAMRVSHAPNPPYTTGKESEWDMDIIGQGPAAVYQDGAEIMGTWKKSSRTERTRFYRESGEEIQLNRGKIWIEVVPQGGSFSQSTI